ncbi:TPA: BRO-N domain-containing protein, partial [Acinetobacter baumannii]
MSNVSVFNFNQNEVRTIVKDDGEIWFVLSDVCSVLEIGNPSDAARRLDNDEVTLDIIEGNHRPTNLVNESGLYSLVLTSRKPEAKQFKKWVTSDVLPSIRKNGGYIAGQENDDPEIIMAKALQVANNVILRKTQELQQARAERDHAITTKA